MNITRWLNLCIKSLEKWIESLFKRKVITNIYGLKHLLIIKIPLESTSWQAVNGTKFPTTVNLRASLSRTIKKLRAKQMELK